MKRILSLVLASVITITTLVSANAGEITVQSSGMVCESCVNRITKQLKKNDSVESVAVDLQTQTVQIVALPLLEQT